MYSIAAAIDYSFYVEYVHRGKYSHGRHTRFISSILERVEKGEITRLIVNLPPRHSKSMTISETFPSWFIGRKPDRKVIVVSYGEALARRFGRSNRRKIEEFGPSVFGIQLDPDASSVTHWNIAGHGGQVLSTGIGGPISGEGADLLLIDDPIKNRQEADSPTYREMIWDEWRNTLYPRLQPNGVVIIVMTRWHEDDLVGRILREEPGKWVVLRLPALAEDADLLGRQPGEPLWPEFGFDLQWALETKCTVGTYVWEALYQQRPGPAEGGIIKRHWFKYYNRPMQPDEFDEIIQSWDMSFKDADDSSYVVGQVWGRKGADKFLLDQIRDRMDFVATIRAVRSLSAKWPLARAKLVEDRANGPAVISVLKREISGLIPVSPKESKESRLAAVSPQFEAGNVYFPDPSIAPWVHDLVEELVTFPNGANDDQVDATTQALLRFADNAVAQLRVRAL